MKVYLFILTILLNCIGYCQNSDSSSKKAKYKSIYVLNNKTNTSPISRTIGQKVKVQYHLESEFYTIKGVIKNIFDNKIVVDNDTINVDKIVSINRFNNLIFPPNKNQKNTGEIVSAGLLVSGGILLIVGESQPCGGFICIHPASIAGGLMMFASLPVFIGTKINKLAKRKKQRTFLPENTKYSFKTYIKY